MEGFRYPTDIWFYGRPYTFKRFTMVDGVKYAVYEDKDLEVEQAFSLNSFKYNEHYGNIERSER